MKRTMTVKENYEFRRIYAKGRSGVSPYLVVYVRPNRRGRNRLGVTVSTKLGHAVVRNRVRRRLREIFRLNQGGLAQGYDMILVARTRAVGAEYREKTLDAPGRVEALMGELTRRFTRQELETTAAVLDAFLTALDQEEEPTE